MISGFCHEADEICALLGYYTAHSKSPYSYIEALYQSPFQGSRSLTLEDGTDRLSQHVSIELPLYTV